MTGGIDPATLQREYAVLSKGAAVAPSASTLPSDLLAEAPRLFAPALSKIF
jgi:hypothetical protein